MWKGQLVITFGKYAGQSFRWLLENDVGWVVWLLSEYCQKGEKNELLKWQKEQLLKFVREFPSVTCHLDKRLEVIPGLLLLFLTLHYNYCFVYGEDKFSTFNNKQRLYIY